MTHRLIFRTAIALIQIAAAFTFVIGIMAFSLMTNTYLPII